MTNNDEHAASFFPTDPVISSCLEIWESKEWFLPEGSNNRMLTYVDATTTQKVIKREAGLGVSGKPPQKTAVVPTGFFEVFHFLQVDLMFPFFDMDVVFHVFFSMLTSPP